MENTMIDYETISEDACEEMVLNVLRRLADLGSGNTGANKVNIVFNTTHPGVIIPDAVRLQFPESVMLVFEHQFYDLLVDTETRCITVDMVFSGRTEHLVLPFKSILTLMDSGVDVTIPVRSFINMTIHEKPSVCSAPRDNQVDDNVITVSFGNKK
mgnify:CR=1 FL=1